ncbi:MAG: ERCC4 domain-containing protein [archaeon]|nr:ERCC4 domain-containing protein [archaeon]
MTFHNIFSKKPLKEKPKLKILIDNREKNSLVASYLAKDFIIEFQQLPIGDYIVQEVAIERKTISDLKSSIINKRIFSQLQELKQFPKHLLLIEGISEEDIYSGTIHENALRGFLLSVALEYQVPIIFTKDSKDTASYLSVLAKKTKKPESSIRPSKIALTKEEQIQFILEGFPNIGPTKAKKLIEKFKSLKNIFNTSEEELKEILGVRAKEFKDLID